jgi:hypothetical protein
MPAGGEATIAGAYNCVYNGSPMGMMNGDSGLPTFSCTEHEEPVNSTDRYGRTKIDGFYLGGDWFSDFDCIEWLPATKAAWWPWGALMEMGVIARRRFDNSKPLVLTAVAGTPAAGASPSATAGKSLLASNYNTRIIFGPTLRKLPIRLELMPYKGGSGVIWGTIT